MKKKLRKRLTRKQRQASVTVQVPDMTQHHWIPRSRGGTNNHVVEIPQSFHRAWHGVFGNLTPKECEDFLTVILIAFRDFKRLDSNTIHTLREACKEER